MLFGRALSSRDAGHQKLPKILALPIFSSDALSSVAYATEAIMGELVVVGTLALSKSIPIAIAIALLILVVSLSYRQIIYAFPNGGGAYPVAMQNLGPIWALEAGAALLIDYVLTVAVSVASGIGAVGSFIPWVNEHTVLLGILATLLIMSANLRGVKESGSIFALPVYIFIFSLFILIIAGFAMLVTGHAHIPSNAQYVALAQSQKYAVGTGFVGIWLILRAFSSGCSALTGLEAISNTVPFFQKPADRNAAITMAWMAFIAIVLFVGTTYLALIFRTIPMDPTRSDYQTIISQIGHVICSNSHFMWFYYLVQISTAIVLVLAANTAFSGFPQLSAMLAKDRYLPRQLASIGDRLVYANGIVILAALSCALLIIFGGNVFALIPLYAVGVFTSFTIAQSGMVVRWLREKSAGWRVGIAINSIGAVVTAVVTVIFVTSKFAAGDVISPSVYFPTFGVFDIGSKGVHHIGMHAYRAWQHAHPGASLPGITLGPGVEPHYGAWMVAVLIPLLVWMFVTIHRHYHDADEQLNLDNFLPHTPQRTTAIVLVPKLHRGVIEALRWAATTSKDVRAIHVEIDEAATPALKQEWEKWSNGVPLIILASPYRSLIGPLVSYVKAVQREETDDLVTIVLPEFVSPQWWHAMLHNQAGLLLKIALSTMPGVVVANVRYFLSRTHSTSRPELTSKHI
jgi:amino acid transporter